MNEHPATDSPRPPSDELATLLARCLEDVRALDLPELADSLPEPTHDPRWDD